MTCLQAATRHNRLACVQLLSAAPGVNANFAVDDGLTALHLACRLGLSAVVQVLAAVPYADLSAEGGSMHDTPLLMAIKGEHVSVVRVLLSFRCVLEAKSLSRALDLASNFTHPRCNNVEIKKILEEALSQLREVNTAGFELFRAANSGDLTILGPLVDKWRDNERVLDWVAPEGTLLDTSDADDDDDDDNEDGVLHVGGMTPVFIACYRGHSQAARLLLTTPGVSPYTVTHLGTSLLLCAATKGNVEVLRTVLSAAPDIDINHADINGATACLLAADHGHAECLRELLLQHSVFPGVDVNHRNKNDLSGLMQAVFSGNVQVVSLLLAVPGVEINHTGTKRGTHYFRKSPLDIALRPPHRHDGHAEIARLLLAAGAKTRVQQEEELMAVLDAALQAEEAEEAEAAAEA